MTSHLSWNLTQLADVIESTRRGSVYQGIGAHPVCLGDEYWKMICEALRAPMPEEVTKLVEAVRDFQAARRELAWNCHAMMSAANDLSNALMRYEQSLPSPLERKQEIK